MSTAVARESDRIFAALREAFERASAIGPVAMVFTVSDARPTEARGTGAVGGL